MKHESGEAAPAEGKNEKEKEIREEEEGEEHNASEICLPVTSSIALLEILF